MSVDMNAIPDLLLLNQLAFTLNVCWCECFCAQLLLKNFSCLSNKTSQTNMVCWVGTRLKQRHTAKCLLDNRPFSKYVFIKNMHINEP